MGDQLTNWQRQLESKFQEAVEAALLEGGSAGIRKLFEIVTQLRPTIEELTATRSPPADSTQLEKRKEERSPLVCQLHLHLDWLWQSRIEQIVEELKCRAERDPLTGLRHRAAFEGRVREEISLSQQNSEPFVLLLFDLDRFKSVNDRYGHPAGDQLLVEMAQLLRSTLREIDEAFRIGGDEFAVLCRRSERNAGEPLAMKLERELQALAEGRGWVGAGHLSWGVATYPGDLVPVHRLLGGSIGEERVEIPRVNDEIDSLIRIADQNLYHCKAKRQADGGKGGAPSP
jgi:diguanylate cyclase (GGDEF)-like protein